VKREITFRTESSEITLDLLFLIVAVVMLIIGHLTEFIISLISIFLHELGHIMAAACLGCKISNLRILPVGMNAIIDNNMCTIREKLIINFSGPLVNILLVFLSFSINLFVIPNDQHVIFFASVNAYLFIFNLFPVLPLDGGMIVRDILIEKYGIFLANKFVSFFTLFLSVFILMVGVFQLLGNKHNFSLLIIGFYVISSTNFKKMEAAIMNIKSVIYRRSRLLKKGIYAARDLVVVKNIPMSELLKSMDFDRFHIIHVLDEELRLIKIFTEQEIIDGMLKYDSDMTFEEFIKVRENC
jgi:stage IV sporulation protein FB